MLGNTNSVELARNGMWKQLNCHDHEHMIKTYNVWIDEKRKEKQILTLSEMILRWSDILPLAKQS